MLRWLDVITALETQRTELGELLANTKRLQKQEDIRLTCPLVIFSMNKSLQTVYSNTRVFSKK